MIQTDMRVLVTVYQLKLSQLLVVGLCPPYSQETSSSEGREAEKGNTSTYMQRRMHGPDLVSRELMVGEAKMAPK